MLLVSHGINERRCTLTCRASLFAKNGSDPRTIYRVQNVLDRTVRPLQRIIRVDRTAFVEFLQALAVVRSPRSSHARCLFDAILPGMLTRRESGFHCDVPEPSATRILKRSA